MPDLRRPPLSGGGAGGFRAFPVGSYDRESRKTGAQIAHRRASGRTLAAYIAKASQHFGIPQTWIATVMQTGSAG
jgi:hypothetical protein